MSWAGIASNQCVSYTNLKDAVDTSVFIAKTTQTTSNREVTKAVSESLVYLNTGTAAWTALTSNQLPVKSDYTPATTYNVDIYAKWGLNTSNYDYDVYAYYDSTAAQYMGLADSDFCQNLNTIVVPSGATLYIYALRAASPFDQVYIRGGTTCPSNLDVVCVYNAGVITSAVSRAITIYIDGSGDPRSCT